ncbi:hypothetical protein [Pseudogracilibacillus auburnensis]|uniref:hypothetical protein n=1 Tax=Pseudogracilibacillus auburnensis TaxID=1494959 RepID=UPI001A957F01|nr:hypothetical protein [Pseudogracilibacillus auburnensis]MBO1005645.1 hypothetical protein [Pseudogracilibacillus auburnensis]
MSNTKMFEDFRNNWLTDEKHQEIINQSMEHVQTTNPKNAESALVSFSATHSLLVLAEYHEWLNE